MTASADKVETGRQLISQALTGTLTNGEIEKVMDLWHSELCNHSSFIPSVVAKQIAANLGITEREVEISDQLTRALLASSHSSPAQGAAAVGESTDTGGKGGSNQLVVLNALLGAILKQIKSTQDIDLAHLHDDLASDLPSMGLSKGAQEIVKPWCQGSVASINQDIPLGDMKTLVHHIYVWCCEEFGPVPADNLFADSITEAKRVPESNKFSPKQLL